MKRKTIWIVVASQARARIFSKDTTKSVPLAEIYALVNPQSRLHQRDVMADRPGRSYDRLGRARHALQDRYSLRRESGKLFTGRICALLEQARRQNKFQHLILVASAEFAASLRRRMGAELESCIQREIHKNVSTLPAHLIPSLLSRAA
jgi:protein required for attachment to host cells